MATVQSILILERLMGFCYCELNSPACLERTWVAHTWRLARRSISSYPERGEEKGENDSEF